MRKRFLALLLTASAFIGAGQANAAVNYPDVPSDHWARTYIGKLSEKQVMTGYPSGKFVPNAQVTRAEFAKIVVLASGVSVSSTSSASSFSDVPQGSWATPYIETAKTNGIVSGYQDGLFKPVNFVTRAEIAKMVMIARQTKKTTGLKQVAAASFNDISNNWARDYINEAKELGIIGGYSDGSFGPGKYVTRAEVAKIVSLAFANVLGMQITNESVPKVNITSPTALDAYTTSANKITISGTASDDKGVTEISWINNTGGKGTAKTGSTWSIKDITLKQGLNIITVTASDADGNMGTDAIRVTYNPGSSGDGSGGGSSNTKSPSLQIKRDKIYWANQADKDNRVLSVDFIITNDGTGDALSPSIDEHSIEAGNGVTFNSAVQPSGTIASKTSTTITIKYNVPEKTETFYTTINFECKDFSGNIYSY